MRLNRVLLLAAAINLMIFAMVFTISCSNGEDGKDGRNGTYDCSVDLNDEDVYVITCGGEEIGTFVGSSEGSKGDPGPDGGAGDQGPYCWLDKQTATGSYPIRCGNPEGVVTTPGSLDGCSNPESGHNFETIISCGDTKINLCDGEAFNPAEKYCTMVGGNVTLLDQHGKIKEYLRYCGDDSKKPYYYDKSYCGYASEADYKKGALSVLPRCGTLDEGDLDYYTGEQPNEVIWENKYCSYTHPKSKGVIALAEVCGDPSKGVKVKINEGSFQGQYCGWSSATATWPSVQKGSCPNPTNVEDADDVGWREYKGPHEAHYNAGYCAYNRQGKVTFSTDICEANKHPNSSKWNGEYCGYANKSASSAAKVHTGICDDGQGPHMNGFNDGYCEYDRSIFGTKLSTNFCVDEIGSDNLPVRTGKPNEGSWKGEYCGCANKDCTKLKVVSGLCDDGDGPQLGENNKGYCRADHSNGDSTYLETTYCGKSGKINAGSWKGEYCGVADEESTENDTVYEGACDDGQGPNTDAFASGYCRANRNGKTEKVTEYCGEGGTINEGKWKGEYCGFESAASVANDKVLTGACDDGLGPNRDGFEVGYCQMQSESDTLTALVTEFCGEDGKMNEGKWKGEYCFADLKVAACTGGWVPNLNKLSTDPYGVRCAFADAAECTAERPDRCDETECSELAAEVTEEGVAYEFDGVCKEILTPEAAAKRLAKKLARK